MNLYTEKTDFRRNAYGELCGWGATTCDADDARLGSAECSNSLNCMDISLQNSDYCHSDIRGIDFRSKHMCGYGNEPMQKITLVIT